MLRNMYTQTLVQPWDLACAIMEVLGDFHTTSHLHFRLRIEKNTSRQTVRFCVRQTCTQISNTAFPSHLCAPQIKNHNSSLTVTTDHRTQTIFADQKKSAHLVINCVPQKLNFHTQVRYPTFPWQIAARTTETHKDCECSEVQTLVSDRHQALFAQSGTKNSNNPFSSLHFSRAMSHDMPSSAAALQVATVTKANLAGKIASRQKSLTSPWHGLNALRHDGCQFQHALPTVLKIHPIVCKICLVNLEPRNIPPNRSCCNTAHPIGSNDLDSPPKRRFSTRTHTHIFRFPRTHK